MHCEAAPEGLSSRADGQGRRGFDPGPHSRSGQNEDRNDMDESVRKSCWGVTAKAVIGFAGIMMLAWLFGGPEVTTVLAGG